MKLTKHEKGLAFSLAMIGGMLLFMGTAFAQVVAPEVVVEQSPLEAIMSGATLIIGGVFLWMIRTTVALLPALIREWIDSKRQRDLHSAVMSKVAQLMREGRWPTAADLSDVGGEVAKALKPAVIEEIRGYINEYSPAAGKWAELDKWTEKGQDLLRTLAARKATEIEKDSLLEALRKAGAPVGGK